MAEGNYGAIHHATILFWSVQRVALRAKNRKTSTVG